MTQHLIDRVEAAITKANEGSTKLSDGVLAMEGMSSRKVRTLLNELITHDDRYLEVGVYKGSTFTSALFGNEYASAIAIDNFTQFGGNESAFLTNTKTHGVHAFDHINADCFALTPEQKSLISDITIYFYDGDHREEDQHKAITYYHEYLAPEFILIVDDWNHPPVKVGTRTGLAEAGITVHKEWELPAARNGDVAQWWNGFYVAVCSCVGTP